MHKKELAYATIAFVIAISAGLGTYYLTTPAISAANVKNWAIASFNKVSTFKLSAEVSVFMNISAFKAENKTMALKTLIEGATNMSANKTWLYITVMLPNNATKMLEMYIIDNYAYFKRIEPGSSWIKVKLPYENRTRQGFLSSQISLLNKSEVKLLPSEVIDEKPCYVLELKPDLEDLWRALSSQPAFNQSVSMPTIATEKLQQVVKSFSAKMWIDKEEKLLRKAQTTISMEMDLGLLGTIAGNLNITLRFYDYNKPIHITLPQEAQNATELQIVKVKTTEIPHPPKPQPQAVTK